VGLPDLWSLGSISIPHLTTPSLHNITWLPSPLAIGATGAGFIVAAVLAVLLLKAIRAGVYLGAAGLLCLFASAVAGGYEAMGEDKIIPQLEAANAKLEQAYQRAAQFQADAVAAQNKAAAAVRDRAALMARLKKALEDGVNGLPKEVADTRVGAAAGVLLNSTVAAVNDSAFGAGAGQEAAAVAAAAADSTVRDWVRWGGEVSQLYGACASQVIGLQEYVAKLAESSRVNDQLK
jgi:hypothetical protein